MIKPTQDIFLGPNFGNLNRGGGASVLRYMVQIISSILPFGTTCTIKRGGRGLVTQSIFTLHLCENN